MQIENLTNETRQVIAQLENFKILEYLKDASVAPENATTEYFMSEMGVRRRQVVIEFNGTTSAICQAGSMQWMCGNITAGTGLKGAGDLLGKMVKSKLTKESAIKPEYSGTGLLVLEPTYKYIILQDIASWGQGMTIEDGMFLACAGTVQNKLVARGSLSSAAMGGEGLFNLSLTGTGVAALESNVPPSELIEITLDNDELKIDGNLAVCWSSNLSFTVERTTKTLIGSAVSGEGLVNVFRGTGKVLMSPVTPSRTLGAATQSMAAKAAATTSNVFGH